MHYNSLLDAHRQAASSDEVAGTASTFSPAIAARQIGLAELFIGNLVFVAVAQSDVLAAPILGMLHGW